MPSYSSPGARGRRRCAGLAAVLLLSASPAWAQYGNYGAQQRPTMPDRPQQQAQEQQPAARTSTADVHRAAACIVGRDAAKAGALLATTPFSREERREVNDLMRAAQRCIRADAPIVTAAFLFRGAVAEALYEAQFATPAAAPNPALRVTPGQLGPEVPAEVSGAITSSMTLSDCSVASQPDAIRTVLATEVSSEAELASLQSLGPILSRCVAAGGTLSADRTILRITLAESLYRWSAVQRDGATSPWAMATATAAAPAPAAPAQPQ